MNTAKKEPVTSPSPEILSMQTELEQMLVQFEQRQIGPGRLLQWIDGKNSDRALAAAMLETKYQAKLIALNDQGETADPTEAVVTELRTHTLGLMISWRHLQILKPGERLPNALTDIDSALQNF